jgi:hypothetical protein
LHATPLVVEEFVEVTVEEAETYHPG